VTFLAESRAYVAYRTEALVCTRKNLSQADLRSRTYGPENPVQGVARPWILGSYAVYAHNLHAARLVYEYARQSDPGPFGTVELETGEAIDWNNMNYGVGDHHG